MLFVNCQSISWNFKCLKRSRMIWLQNSGLGGAVWPLVQLVVNSGEGFEGGSVR